MNVRKRNNEKVKNIDCEKCNKKSNLGDGKTRIHKNEKKNNE